MEATHFPHLDAAAIPDFDRALIVTSELCAFPPDQAMPAMRSMTNLNRRGRSPEFNRLMGPQPDGPTIGYLGDHPIASAVVDHFGRRYLYVGAAPRRPNGQYDADALGAGEFLMEPGLVYRCDPMPTPGILKRLLHLE